MTASITKLEAIEHLKQNNFLDSDDPGTYPHIIESSITYKPTENGMEAIYYLVNNGRTLEERGWIYEADYP